MTIAPVPTRLVDPKSNPTARNHSASTTNARWIFVEDKTANVRHVPGLEEEKSARVLAGEYCEVIRAIDSLPKSR